MEYRLTHSEMFGTSIIREDGEVSTVIYPIEGSTDYEQYLIDTDGGLPMPEVEGDPSDSDILGIDLLPRRYYGLHTSSSSKPQR